MKTNTLYLNLVSLLFVSLINAQVPNDLCQGATILDVGEGGLCTNILVTINGTETDSGIEDPGCGNYEGGDLWYKLTLPPSGEMAVETSDAGTDMFDTAMAVYTGSDCDNLILYECDDDSGEYFFSKIHVSGSAGSDIYVRVWENENASPRPARFARILSARRPWYIKRQGTYAPPLARPCAALATAPPGPQRPKPH